MATKRKTEKNMEKLAQLQAEEAELEANQSNIEQSLSENLTKQAEIKESLSSLSGEEYEDTSETIVSSNYANDSNYEATPMSYEQGSVNESEVQDEPMDEVAASAAENGDINEDEMQEYEDEEDEQDESNLNARQEYRFAKKEAKLKRDSEKEEASDKKDEAKTEAKQADTRKEKRQAKKEAKDNEEQAENEADLEYKEAKLELKKEKKEEKAEAKAEKKEEKEEAKQNKEDEKQLEQELSELQSEEQDLQKDAKNNEDALAKNREQQQEIASDLGVSVDTTPSAEELAATGGSGRGIMKGAAMAGTGMAAVNAVGNVASGNAGIENVKDMIENFGSDFTDEEREMYGNAEPQSEYDASVANANVNMQQPQTFEGVMPQEGSMPPQEPPMEQPGMQQNAEYNNMQQEQTSDINMQGMNYNGESKHLENSVYDKDVALDNSNLVYEGSGDVNAEFMANHEEKVSDAEKVEKEVVKTVTGGTSLEGPNV